MVARKQCSSGCPTDDAKILIYLYKRTRFSQETGSTNSINTCVHGRSGVSPQTFTAGCVWAPYCSNNCFVVIFGLFDGHMWLSSPLGNRCDALAYLLIKVTPSTTPRSGWCQWRATRCKKGIWGKKYSSCQNINSWKRPAGEFCFSLLKCGLKRKCIIIGPRAAPP